MNKYKLLLFALVLILAGALRLPGLSERPMHTDEAVHGIKFGLLLEQGSYVYDTEDFHGPTLNYLTLPFAWLSGQHSLEQVGEATLRSAPALAGLLTILMMLLLVKDLGWMTVMLSALLMAVSPAMAYFSRYYIQEPLMVLFCFGIIICLVRSINTGNRWWYLGTGVFGGLAIATKETWIIHIPVLLISVFVINRTHFRASLKGSKSGTGQQDSGTVHPDPGSSIGNWSVSWQQVLFLLIPLILIPVLLYGSFFRNPAGIGDAVAAFATYFDRAGSDPDHLHPWYYYFRILGFRSSEGMIWSETWILLLAAVGIFLLFRNFLGSRADFSGGKRVLPVIAFYGLTLMLIYSVIPYKTPWNLLHFYQALIIPAGFALAWIIRKIRSPEWRITGIVLAGGLFLFTSWQAWHTVFDRSSDPANPFVYAHPNSDVFEISDRIHEIREQFPEAKIEVVYRNHEYWPLPWYLRDLGNTGWWETVDLDAPAGDIVLADPSAENDLLRKWYEVPPAGKKHLYVPLFSGTMEIRHGVEILSYIRQDLR